MRNSITLLMVFASTILRAQIPDGYYNSAQGLAGEPLKAELNDIIDGHITLSYDDCWDALKVTDRDPLNAANVVGIYSRFSMNGNEEFDNGNGWSREHVWSQSRGDFGTSRGPGTDIHALRAEDVSTNSARSNRPFDTGGSIYVDVGGTYNGVTPARTSSTFTWEPGDDQKGDVARMLFYMSTRYEGENDEPDLELTEELLPTEDTQPLHGKLSTLLLWHESDPVDDAEIARNEIVFSYQGNRNPFIDHPEFVSLIWGDAIAEPAFVSNPVTRAVVNTPYQYAIETAGGNGILTISAEAGPDWVELMDNGDGAATLSGTPPTTGSFAIELLATDAENQSATQAFTIEVVDSGNAADLLISEYIEGSSFNKAIELANFTGFSIDLADYDLRIQFNGSGTWSSGLELSGALSHEQVFVVANSSADPAILSEADYIGGNTELLFNGNDVLGLFKNDQLIDVLGNVGDASNYAVDVTLVRRDDIVAPNSIYTDTEWLVYSVDSFEFLGMHDLTIVPPNSPPSVHITAPENNETFALGTEISLQADANDEDGTVNSVAFLLNGDVISTDFSSPFEASFTVFLGDNSLTAIATDDDGATTQSSAVEVIGVASNLPPTVELSSPSDGASFTPDEEVTVQASANDPDGEVVSVEFFVNGASIGTDSSAPFESTFLVAEGENTLTAIAIDNGNVSTVSTAISVMGIASNQPPNVELISPSDGTSFTTGEKVMVQASANDPDGEIVSVEFFVNENTIGSVTSTPYVISFEINEGTNELKATATDDSDETVTSETIVLLGETTVLDAEGSTSRIEVYPNPAQDLIRVSGLTNETDAQLVIVDSQGRTVFQEVVEAHKSTHVFSVSSWSKGVYIFYLNNQFISKFVL